MKKKTPFLDFYCKYIETGYLPEPGLCFSFPYRNMDCLFNDWFNVPRGYSGYKPEGKIYFNEDVDDLSYKRRHEITHRFTPLRQTIVLLCAAINGEL